MPWAFHHRQCRLEPSGLRPQVRQPSTKNYSSSITTPTLHLPTYSDEGGNGCRSGRTGSEGSQRNPHEISKVSDEQIIGSQWFRAIFISKPAEGRLVWESGNQSVDPNVDGKGRMNAVASPTCLMVLVGAHVVVGSHFHRVSGSFCPSYTGNNTRSGLRLACSGSGCNPTFHHGWPLALKRPSEMIDQ